MNKARILLKPWFILMLTIALAHQLTQKIFLIYLPWADSYLDPLLFMPILLQLVLWERRVLFKKGPDYILEWWRVASVVVFVSILAEVIYPLMSTKFTADPYDVFCYSVGAFVFWAFWNKGEQRSTSRFGGAPAHLSTPN